MFLSGVIEGFYGPLWTQAERLELFDWMQRWGLNTYFYGPKDDLHHRVLWREAYSQADTLPLAELIQECRFRGLEFVYALGPGLDIRYASETDFAALQGRLAQLTDLGCRNVCLLFDDIPDRMHPEDAARWTSLASAQCDLTNRLLAWLRGRGPVRFLFCPTPYCSRMADARHGGEGYLETVGRELDPSVDIFWTGPEIISEEITVAHVEALATVLRRKPLIWDNLHANDYDGRRVFCGPYSGRPPELRAAVAGVLCNPNTEFPVNFVPLHTFGAWLHDESGTWDPRAAYLAAMRDWLPRFESAGKAVELDDLVLFGDTHYLPYEDGPGARNLQASLSVLLAKDPSDWTAADSERFLAEAQRLREFCVRVTELRDRSLFSALSRRIWELREEIELLGRHVQFHADPANRGRVFRSDFHRPGTYRGGFVPGLQRLLEMGPDGAFTPAAAAAGQAGTGALSLR